ncbi:MAG: hypothetical protein ACRD4V_02870 [Candidatus Acidiferrales bacterium]
MIPELYVAIENQIAFYHQQIEGVRAELAESEDHEESAIIREKIRGLESLTEKIVGLRNAIVAAETEQENALRNFTQWRTLVGEIRHLSAQMEATARKVPPLRESVDICRQRVTRRRDELTEAKGRKFGPLSLERETRAHFENIKTLEGELASAVAQLQNTVLAEGTAFATWTSLRDKIGQMRWQAGRLQPPGLARSDSGQVLTVA